MAFKLLKIFSTSQVVLFTIIELYNEEDTINHHGFSREVSNPEIENKANYKEKIYTTAKLVGKKLKHNLIYIQYYPFF